MGKGGASGGLRAQKGVGAEEWGKEGQFLQVPLPSSCSCETSEPGAGAGQRKAAPGPTPLSVLQIRVQTSGWPDFTEDPEQKVSLAP